MCIWAYGTIYGWRCEAYLYLSLLRALCCYTGKIDNIAASQLESQLAIESLLESLFESMLEHLLERQLESLLERAALEKATLA
jgi:hypothetical protein